MSSKEIEVADPFEVLIENLPKSELLNIKTRYPKLFDEKTIIHYVSLFRSSHTSYFKNTDISDISRISLIAYSQNKFSFNEVVSLHLVLAAWNELFLDLTGWMYLHDFNHFGKPEYFILNQGKIIPTPKRNQIWKLHYDSPGIIDAKHFLHHETYQTLCEKVGTAYGKHELEPILKKSFAFNDKEWKLFTELMENESLPEQQFHLINLPIVGAWSTFLQHLPKLFKSFAPVKLFYSSAGKIANYELYFNDALPVPSFSAIQNYLKVKAANHGRKAIQLVPIFGSIDGPYVYSLRLQGKWPLGVYYSAPSDPKQRKKMNKYVYNLDKSPGNSYDFSIHDIYHATRQQELPENMTEATFRIVELLREFEKSHPALKKLIDSEVILKVSEGTLIHAYGIENSPFYPSIPNQKFGHIFHCKWVHWTEEMIHYIIEDMVKEQALWRKEFDLGPEDLLELEKKYYEEVSEYLFKEKLA